MQSFSISLSKPLKVFVQPRRRSTLDLTHQELPKTLSIPRPYQIALLKLPQRLQRGRAAVTIHRRLNIPVGTMIHPLVEYRFKRIDQAPLTTKRPALLNQINRRGRKQPSCRDCHPVTKGIPYHQRMPKRRQQNQKIKQTTQRRSDHNRRQ